VLVLSLLGGIRRMEVGCLMFLWEVVFSSNLGLLEVSHCSWIVGCADGRFRFDICLWLL